MSIGIGISDDTGTNLKVDIVVVTQATQGLNNGLTHTAAMATPRPLYV
jgi:hypothetical protein